MLVTPLVRSMLITRFLSEAMVGDALPVRTCDRFSSRVTSRTQCRPVLDGPVAACPGGQLGGSGLVGGEAGDRVHGFDGGPLRARGLDPTGFASDLDSLAGVRERDPGPDRDDLECALLDAAMCSVGTAVHDGHVLPRQCFQLVVQRGVVRLHAEQIVSVSFEYHVVGVRLLRVQSIGGDDSALELIETPYEPGKHRKLVGLGGDIDLSEHHPSTVIDSRKQVPGLVGVATRTPDGFAVYGDDPPAAGHLCGVRRRPLPDRSV